MAKSNGTIVLILSLVMTVTGSMIHNHKAVGYDFIVLTKVNEYTYW